MPRKKKVDETEELPRARTWTEYRMTNGMPPSLELREKGKCYDCGSDLPDSYHTRTIDRGRTVWVVTFCCACAGHATV